MSTATAWSGSPTPRIPTGPGGSDSTPRTRPRPSSPSPSTESRKPKDADAHRAAARETRHGHLRDTARGDQAGPGDPLDARLPAALPDRHADRAARGHRRPGQQHVRRPARPRPEYHPAAAIPRRADSTSPAAPHADPA